MLCQLKDVLLEMSKLDLSRDLSAMFTLIHREFLTTSNHFLATNYYILFTILKTLPGEFQNQLPLMQSTHQLLQQEVDVLNDWLPEKNFQQEVCLIDELHLCGTNVFKMQCVRNTKFKNTCIKQQMLYKNMAFQL